MKNEEYTFLKRLENAQKRGRLADANLIDVQKCMTNPRNFRYEMVQKYRAVL